MRSPGGLYHCFCPTVYYPDPVSDAWLDLRIHLNGDLNVVYVEEWNGERWTCRWDRHENDHNAREHFHPPPDVTARTAIDVELPADPYRTVGIALQFIEDRIRELWGRTDLTYPSDYEFAHEYGPDIGR